MGILEANRAAYDRSLTVPCTIFSPERNNLGGSTGGYDFVKHTVCGVNQYGSGRASPFVNALARSVGMVGTPGSRRLCFTHDENVGANYMVVLALVSSWDDLTENYPDEPRYRVGLTNKDDPLRMGLEVQAELHRYKPDP